MLKAKYNNIIYKNQGDLKILFHKTITTEYITYKENSKKHTYRQFPSIRHEVN